MKHKQIGKILMKFFNSEKEMQSFLNTPQDFCMGMTPLSLIKKDKKYIKVIFNELNNMLKYEIMGS